ncbi:hypothetical protein OXYTRIMIC_606 [Oxytricha trifallax]|uniref:Uncharacterized protein n=1 Tax=Oxytricha trifallax TaxID=1172189 RepID=A0A073I070_9SPIT|nr:hypothetical protein OXYTRIMIC_606 [Oxytricha trifallax]
MLTCELCGNEFENLRFYLDYCENYVSWQDPQKFINALNRRHPEAIDFYQCFLHICDDCYVDRTLNFDFVQEYIQDQITCYKKRLINQIQIEDHIEDKWEEISNVYSQAIQHYQFDKDLIDKYLSDMSSVISKLTNLKLQSLQKDIMNVLEPQLKEAQLKYEKLQKLRKQFRQDYQQHIVDGTMSQKMFQIAFDKSEEKGDLFHKEKIYQLAVEVFRKINQGQGEVKENPKLVYRVKNKDKVKDDEQIDSEFQQIIQ